MQHAIEFLAKKKRGKIIEIPEEYAASVAGEFRVILILNTQLDAKKPAKEAKKPAKTAKKTFKAFKAKTKGFKFNRDEIYADE